MSKNTLEVLFDSKARLKILKYLFRNYGSETGAREISEHTQEHISTVKRELKKFIEISLVKTTSGYVSKKEEK